MVPEDYAYEQLDSAFVVCRIPRFPLSLAWDLLAADDPIGEARTLLADARIEAALYVASPSLHRAAMSWFGGGKLKNRRTPLAVLSYLLRMATRPTPFGIFSSVGLVTQGVSGSTIAPARRRIHIRPEFPVLAEIAKYGADRALSLGRLVLFSNDTIARRGDRIFIPNEGDVTASNRAAERSNYIDFEYTPSSIRSSPLIEDIIGYCVAGAKAIDLQDMLLERHSAAPERSQPLIAYLLQLGLLYSDYNISAVGSPHEQLAQLLSGSGDPNLTSYQEIQAVCFEVSGKDPDSVSSSDLERVVAIINSYPEPITNARIQVDSTVEFSGALDADILDAIADYASLCVQGSPCFELATLKKLFLELFESNERLISVADLFHPDFTTPIVAELSRVGRDSATRQNVLGNIIGTACRQRSQDYCLTDSDMANLLRTDNLNDELPEAIEVAVQVVRDIEQGGFSILPGAMGFTSDIGKSFGRFAQHVPGGPALLRHAKEQLSNDTHLDVELTYQNKVSRAANVSIRPRVFDHEIQIGFHNTNCVDRIAVSDLYVGVRGKRIILWSSKHGKHVTVHETHASNAQAATHLTRFLAFLSLDGKRSPTYFDWGAFGAFPFRPRLRRGRYVFSLATWTLSKTDFDCNAPMDVFAERFRTFRLQWDVPEVVNIVSIDNKLPVSTTKDWGIEILREKLSRAQEHLSLEEVVTTPRNALVQESGVPYASEFVASLRRRHVQSVMLPPRAFGPLYTNADRQQGLAEGWLSFKLYFAEHRVDEVLRDHLVPLTQRLLLENAIDGWFFVRYRDQLPHIRFRLHFRDAASSSAMPCVMFVERLLRDNVIDHYQLTSYSRELERYGGMQGIEIAEKCFYINSEQVGAQIIGTPGVSKRTRRSQSLYGAMCIVSSFFKGAELHGWLDALPPRNKKLEASAWDDVRALRLRSHEIVDSPYEGIVNDYASLNQTVSPHLPMRNIVESLLHMHFNRFGLSHLDESIALDTLRASLTPIGQQ